MRLRSTPTPRWRLTEVPWKRRLVRGMAALFQRDFRVAEEYFQAVLIQTPVEFLGE